MYFPFQDLAQGLFGSGAITMYPSNNNGNTNNTLDQTIPYHKPSLSDHNHPLIPSSFFSSPSPYIHYEDDLIFLQYFFQQYHQQQQQQQQPPLIPEASAPDSNNSEIHNRHKFLGLVEQIPKKRISKKDRHSKIETAQGPRDRRMRLSLEIARKFFNLQDMLGVDKASKTVGWLLTKSKTAIEELKRGSAHVKNSSSIVGGNNYSASSTSECEVVSGIAESAVDGNRHARNGKGSKTLGKEKKNVRAISRKSAFDPIARESRDKARARARERTEKKKFDESKQTLEAVNRDTNRLGSRSHFENCKESGNQRLNLLADVDQELSSSIIFNHNNGISQENHFTGFQVYGKPYWEAYNNINLC